MIRSPRALARWGRRWFLLPVLVALLVALAAGVSAASRDAGGVRVYPGTWEYRWGDSPRGPSGALAWAQPGEDGGWEQLGASGSPPGREGQRWLWLRTRLAGDIGRDTTLYLDGVDQIFEAYLDGERIYRFGDLEGPDALRFRGYQGHYLPLDEGSQGKTLALRVYSDHVNIGLFGQQLLGSRAELMLSALRRDLPTLAMGVVLGSIGAFMLALFVIRREDRGYLYYAGFAMCLSLYFVAVSPSRALLADAPLGWVYVELAVLYLMPPFFAAYFERVFGRGWGSVVRFILWGHLAYALGAAVLVAAGAVPVMKTLLPLQLMLLFDFVFLLGRAAPAAIRGNTDARIFTAGFAVAATSGIHDVLAAMGVLSRAQVTLAHYGNFVLTLAMGLILARRFVEVHERLTRYSGVLQLSLASARVLEPGQHAQVALGELLRLLKARRALLFMPELATSPGGEPPPEALVLQAAREVTPGGPPEGSPAALDEARMVPDIVEQARARRKPLIGRTAKGGGPSVLCAPLILRDELLGVVYLERGPERRPFQEDDLEILLGLGGQISIAIVSTRSARLELKSALQRSRLERQGALLEAAARMAAGDLATPVARVSGGELADLAGALEAMRRDVRAKIEMLETRNAEVQSLNEELRRKIEDQTGRMLAALLDEGKGEDEGPPRFRVGAMIGDRYRVLSVLGEGAMGIVYGVERAHDGRRLAVKVLSSRGDKAALARFVREAQILARLDHPNLISIFDVDVTLGGALFLVMELAPGGTLLRFQGRFGDVTWALMALRQIAEALAAVHGSGVVHRDLKLSNVLASEGPGGAPRIKLADFGISILVGEQVAIGERIGEDAPTRPMPRARPAEVTRTGMLVGTPSYMAPELLRGSRGATAASDMWSFGVIAYEVLVGERPFPVPPVFLATQGLPIEAPDGLRRIEDLDPVLAELFERCFSEDPAGRPTAAEVVETLEEFGVEMAAAG